MSFFNWAKNFGGFAPRTNLVTCRLSLAISRRMPRPRRISKIFCPTLQAAGYNVTTLYSYSPRDIAGTGTLSEHAFGNAIDINPGANPVSYNGVVTDLSPNIRDIAAKNDLVWGGDFGGSKKDAMHFEYNPGAVAQGYDANGNLSNVASSSGLDGTLAPSDTGQGAVSDAQLATLDQYYGTGGDTQDAYADLH